MSHFVATLFGPRLYWLFSRAHPYEPNVLESSGDKLFAIGNCVSSICMAFSPILVPYIIFSWPASSYSSTLKMVVSFYAVALSLRTTGRFTNSDYINFIKRLRLAQTQPQNAEVRAALKRYDFQIFGAPPDFIGANLTGEKWFVRQSASTDLGVPLNLARETIAWIAANTFGRRILYPGSLAIFHSMANSQLIAGRTKLIADKGGQRNILLTGEGDKLDSVFVDKRGQGDRGNQLIICCEGNAGFYEMGVMFTPINLQYSVLGWNMPGFAESTGTPYPDSILSAMDSVMQFAIQRLGFQPQQIVLYAWSIGGFPATWAAANYPQIKALILDASFDDLVPLAVARMPSAISGLVRYAVRKHLNLPISEQLNHYNGPVRLIRRWNDEIIATDESSEEKKRASNRANWLLLNLLRNRHPGLIRSDEDRSCVFDWLKREPYERLTDYDEEDSSDPDFSNIDDFALLDQKRRHCLIRQLCTKYFVDFVGATHNMPLNPEYFNIPEPVGNLKK